MFLFWCTLIYEPLLGLTYLRFRQTKITTLWKHYTGYLATVWAGRLAPIYSISWKNAMLWNLFGLAFISYSLNNFNAPFACFQTLPTPHTSTIKRTLPKEDIALMRCCKQHSSAPYQPYQNHRSCQCKNSLNTSRGYSYWAFSIAY